MTLPVYADFQCSGRLFHLLTPHARLSELENNYSGSAVSFPSW